MKRSLVIGATIGALSAVSTHAAAQGVDEFGAYGGLDDRRESPQNVAFEIRVGRYLPNVDDEFGGSTPFNDTFGDDNRFLVGFEVDWQVLKIPKFGTLGPGIGLGYTSASAEAEKSDGSGTSEQETSLAINPVYLVGVLRVDVLMHEFNIPLVPYGKLGLGYAWWDARDGERAAYDDQGVRGKGTSYGYQFSLGGMFNLDFLDPEAAAQLDANMGVNSSYLFIEWYFSQLDGFGSNKLQVGTNTWMLGLALEI